MESQEPSTSTRGNEEQIDNENEPVEPGLQIEKPLNVRLYLHSIIKNI